MKKIIFLVGGLLITALITQAQTIYVANNNPGAATGVNVFTGATALQDAIDAATDGDIVYVVPSLLRYEDANIIKELTVFGIGLRPDKNLAAKSDVRWINIDASNVRISGLISIGISLGNNSADTTFSNIIIENSRISYVWQKDALYLQLDRVLIRNNVIMGGGNTIKFGTISNVTITNNVIYCIGTGTLRGQMLNISNNLFVADGTSDFAIEYAIDCLFEHNIFYGVDLTISSYSTGNVWNDNLSFGSSNDVFPIGLYSNTSNSPNIESEDPLFVNMPLTSTWSDAYDFTLQAGSLAIDVNGTDIGPTGGPIPFDNEGNLLPLIEAVSIPAVIPVGSDLPVKIKAKGD